MHMCRNSNGARGLDSFLPLAALMVFFFLELSPGKINEQFKWALPALGRGEGVSFPISFVRCPQQTQKINQYNFAKYWRSSASASLTDGRGGSAILAMFGGFLTAYSALICVSFSSNFNCIVCCVSWKDLHSISWSELDNCTNSFKDVPRRE